MGRPTPPLRSRRTCRRRANDDRHPSTTTSCLINLTLVCKSRASMESEPRERSAPAPFDFAQGVVSLVEPRSGARESV
jgi:hypothetical protein